VRAAGALVWGDARGLPPRRTARAVWRAARAAGVPAPRVGLATVPLVAELAARGALPAHPGPLVVIPPHAARAALAACPLSALGTSDATAGLWSPRLAAQLADLGLDSCAALAALAPDAVAVRFGAAGAALWRLARGEDARVGVAGAPSAAQALPSASLAWTTYELRAVEALAFVTRRLVARTCADLAARGDVARQLTLHVATAGGGTTRCPVAAARPTADPATWGRLVQAALERLPEGALADGVVGLTLTVDATAEQEAPQGDLWDAGFASAAAAESAVPGSSSRARGA
jgi:nucleotidyltransferase/DNA polymerase involved in DNA repair